MSHNVEDDFTVNELLFYVQNKLHSTPKDAIIDSCVKFYSVDEISMGIETLEKTMNTRMTKRHNSNTTKMMVDIYDKIWTADASATPVPNFVAADLSRIPRVRDNSDSLATTEQLLASLHDLKKRIIQLESSLGSKNSAEG